MSLLKRNINMKGSAFPPKCNIYPYSNLLISRSMPTSPYFSDFYLAIQQFGKNQLTRAEFDVKIMQFAKFYKPKLIVYTPFSTLDYRPISVCEDGVVLNKSSEKIIADNSKKLSIHTPKKLLELRNEVFDLGAKLEKTTENNQIELAAFQARSWVEANSLFSRFDIPIHLNEEHQKYWPKIFQLITEIKIKTGANFEYFDLVSRLSRSGKSLEIQGIINSEFSRQIVLFSPFETENLILDASNPLFLETGTTIVDKSGNKQLWVDAATEWITRPNQAQNFYELVIESLEKRLARHSKFPISVCTLEQRFNDNENWAAISEFQQRNSRYIGVETEFSFQNKGKYEVLLLPGFSFLTKSEKKKFRKDMVIIMRIAREYKLLRYLMPMMRRFTKKHFF